jgi:tetratricopeptide (TPR) repeat protein
MPDHFGELRVGPDQPEHRAVLRSYVAKRLARPCPDGQGPLPAAWAEPLIDQAGGSFLYVFHYCRALHFGVYTDLTQLPPPTAYYPAFFDHLRRRVGDELFHGQYARTLAFLAVAREPVGLTHLEAWGLKRSSLIDILVDLADLLRTRREPWDAETLYTLGHDTTREFLTADTYWRSRLTAANRDLAKQAVRRFGKDWSAVDPFDPVERYLLFHLLDHVTEPELRERLLSDVALANACMQHGGTLSNKGEFASCLLAYDIAVRLREGQVDRRDRRKLGDDMASAFMLVDVVDEVSSCKLRNDLATAYKYRGDALADLGRLDDALEDHGKSIRLYEELTSTENHRELRSYLATSYNSRGSDLFDLGRHEEAFTDFSCAVSLYEELVYREGRRHERGSLALAYMNRGNAQKDPDRRDEALKDHNAAVGLYEELVYREGHREKRGGLATAYMNRGSTFGALGLPEKALDDFSAAISLREELVHVEGRHELCDDLAMAYMNRGMARKELGRLEEALDDYTTCISLAETMVHRDGRRDVAGRLGWAYAAHSDLLLRMGRREEACQRAREAVSILQSELTRTGWAVLRGKLELAEEVARNACD